ncbi:acyl-CoA N-acyltransferase [Podospora aff. communis PSN243]|uniref:Acyl-CoA N-acyltransferase n=1 Tax=Podospora aff. communis PSN243 TaxID=3040156 RepID=A0AAV9GWY2_9PEZI|nr:acyl-CoA N-acyltransferase [Podospora aff. communis PSN243]
MAKRSNLANAWKSERLVYRAVEDDDEDKLSLLELNDGEPSGMAMLNIKPLAPGNKTSSDKFLTWAKGALILAFVCLPPEENQDQKAEGGEKKKPRPKPIGFLVMWYSRGAESAHHRTAEMGFGFGPQHRGKGYGTEAINWLLDWGFMRMGLHRVGLQAFEYNPEAIRLYKRLGFVEEGREREALLFERKWYDLVHMGMLEHEWEKLRELGK